MRIESVNENTCMVYFGDQIGAESAGLVKRATDRLRRDMSDLGRAMRAPGGVFGAERRVVRPTDIGRTTDYTGQRVIKLILIGVVLRHKIDQWNLVVVSHFAVSQAGHLSA